jgi:hypothetical protein
MVFRVKSGWLKLQCGFYLDSGGRYGHLDAMYVVYLKAGVHTSDLLAYIPRLGISTG